MTCMCMIHGHIHSAFLVLLHAVFRCSTFLTSRIIQHTVFQREKNSKNLPFGFTPTDDSHLICHYFDISMEK